VTGGAVGEAGGRWVPELTAESLGAAGLRFDDRGLIPAVVQDADDGQVLMVAWMNAEAVARTLADGRTWFWSRSRHELWLKGETSGHVQHVEAVHADCDGDTLLVLVHQDGVACHTGNRSCFYRSLRAETEEA
jgi:phosphoribosyl-AMP cyclohydrolase